MNNNEFVNGEKRFVKVIRKCRCSEKIDDVYVLECKIQQRGEKQYCYIPGSHYISLVSCTHEGGRLWLTDQSESQADLAVTDFESVLEKADAHGWGYSSNNSPDETFALFYEPASDFLYNCLIKYKDAENHIRCKYMCSMNIGDIIHNAAWQQGENAMRELLFNTTTDNIAENPFYIAAVNSNDITLQNQIKLYYRIADYNECMYISEITGKNILPPLPEEYDKDFYVDSKTVSSELLRNSGYSIGHRPCMAMRGDATYTKWRLNPHTKIGGDTAPKDAEAISFDEYVKMIESHQYNKI